jgi:hypothetical protein
MARPRRSNPVSARRPASPCAPEVVAGGLPGELKLSQASRLGALGGAEGGSRTPTIAARDPKQRLASGDVLGNSPLASARWLGIGRPRKAEQLGLSHHNSSGVAPRSLRGCRTLGSSCRCGSGGGHNGTHLFPARKQTCFQFPLPGGAVPGRAGPGPRRAIALKPLECLTHEDSHFS